MGSGRLKENRRRPDGPTARWPDGPKNVHFSEVFFVLVFQLSLGNVEYLGRRNRFNPIDRITKKLDNVDLGEFGMNSVTLLST